MLVSLSSVSAEKNEQNIVKPAVVYLVYISGHSTLMGCSSDVHLSPFWFQSSSDWVSYGFSGITFIVVNGIPLPSGSGRVYMEGFKGLAPGSLHWAAKSLVGRIRIVGICTNIEIH
jgi:hypothetical protein